MNPVSINVCKDANSPLIPVSGDASVSINTVVINTDSTLQNCPTTANNGQGCGPVSSCGNNQQCRKTDLTLNTICLVVGTVTADSALPACTAAAATLQNCPTTANSGQGCGSIFTCGSNQQCRKTDLTYTTSCLVVGTVQYDPLPNCTATTSQPTCTGSDGTTAYNSGAKICNAQNTNEIDVCTPSSDNTTASWQPQAPSGASCTTLGTCVSCPAGQYCVSTGTAPTTAASCQPAA